MKKSLYLQSLLFFCFILFSAAARAAVPVVTADPANVTVCTGISTKFFVAVTSTPSATYSWEMSSDGSTWSKLKKDTLQYTGTATDTLRIATDLSLNGLMYRAIATNADGADTSVGATLTVIRKDAGTISGTAAICRGTTSTFTSTVAGGTWSSIFTSIATVGATSGDVTGVAFGYDTIRYKVTNTCGDTTTDFLVRVDTVVTAKAITGPTTVCKGNFVTLSNVNVVGTGLWSASNSNATVSSTGVVTGVAHGTTVIYYDFSNSCSIVTSNVTITVDTVLGAGTISGPKEVCNGSWIHLSASVPGGLWISGASPIAVVDGSGNVTGVSQGTAVISYLFSNACGASFATDTIEVSSTTKAISGKDSVGIGATRALTNATKDGKWYSSDTTIATIDTNGLVTGKDTGVTTITYTVTNICGTSSSYLTMNVGPAPSAGAIYGLGGFDSSVCVGATVALFDTAKFGTGTWSSSNDTFAIVSSSGVVTGVKAGTATITYTFENAMGKSTTTIPILVDQAPVISITGPLVVSTGGNYFFRALPYSVWNPPTPINVGKWTASNNVMGQILSVFAENVTDTAAYGTAFKGLNNVASFVVLNIGVDTLTYSLTNACGTSKKEWVVSLSPVGAPQVHELGASLNVFPNPTEGELSINLTTSANEQATVVITNVLGAKVKETTIQSNTASKVKLDVPSGLYFMTVSSPAGTFDSKIVVGR